MTDRVRIYEVGPRDGLQNERTPVPVAAKLDYIERLVAAGLREVEATSFVSPAAIPQLADADELLPTVLASPTVRAASGEIVPDGAPPLRFPVLVPNTRGMDRAEAAGATALAVFTAASDAFTERNIGMTIDASLDAFTPVVRRAAGLGWWRRGYVSTAFGCPYTGEVALASVVRVAARLLEMGVDEVCFGDTIGVAVPAQVRRLVTALRTARIPLDRVAFHFHDTRGTALANVVAALDAGVRTFDSATGGTGGCPYAPGAAGNLATEDLVYLLDATGVEHGVRLERVLDAARAISAALGRPLASKVGQAGGWDRATGAPTGRATGSR